MVEYLYMMDYRVGAHALVSFQDEEIQRDQPESEEGV
jgi:hypothetical protein